MGPKNAPKVVEKIVPKDEAQVIFIKIHIGQDASNIVGLIVDDIIVNILCRGDIIMDYIRKQYLLRLQTLLLKDDVKINDALTIQIKQIQTILTSKTALDLVLQDLTGVDMNVKENYVKQGNTFLTAMSSYCVGVLNDDKSITILKL